MEFSIVLQICKILTIPHTASFRQFSDIESRLNTCLVSSKVYEYNMHNVAGRVHIYHKSYVITEHEELHVEVTHFFFQMRTQRVTKRVSRTHLCQHGGK